MSDVLAYFRLVLCLVNVGTWFNDMIWTRDGFGALVEGHNDVELSFGVYLLAYFSLFCCYMFLMSLRFSALLVSN